MADDNSLPSDEEGVVVNPRPAGKRIHTVDMNSDSNDEDEPEEELFESDEEDEEEEEEEEERSEEDDEDDEGSGSDSDAEQKAVTSSRRKRSSSEIEGGDKKRKKKERKEEKKRKKKERKEKRSKAKSRYGKSIFLDEAEVGSDEDEEEEEEVYREESAMDHELLAIQREAEARAATRHEANRRFQEASASDVVADIENRYKRQKGSMQQGYLGSAEGYMAETTRRSLVPGVNDPGIYMVRTKTGMEQALVKAILLKSIDRQRKGLKLQIKSVFSTTTAGYIYVEAMNEPFAREAITGLNGIYYSTLKQVPIPEMSMLLSLTVKKKPFKEGQWCRMRRAPCKGDLARVLRMLEGGTKALVQVVPRPDYKSIGKSKQDGASRPLQRLFLAEEAKAQQQEVERKRHPVTGEFCDFWNNEYYNHGFLLKEVKVDTFLHHATNPLPRLEEVTLFQEKKRDGDGNDSDDDLQSGGGGSWNSKQGIMKELAKLEEEQAGSEVVVPFRPGDTVQVIDGEQRNLRGVVVTVNDRTGLAVVLPLSEYQLGELTIEVNLLVKYIRPGAHVKVLSGKHLGQTGRVVSVYRSDGDNIAAILTDGINTEITVNMGHLQVTSEVTTGLNSLAGYELYDLLILNANDYGVVVFVGTEHLAVLTVNDILKNVSPMEVKGKKMPSRGATGAFDHLKNPLAVGDTVSVVEGTHIKKTGTIKHINRSVLWLHSTSHLPNSGIFVVKGKSCLLAGSKIKGNSNTAATLLNAAFNTESNQPGATLVRSQAFRKGGGKDDGHGKAVKLTKGGFKGHLGRVVDSTNTHYSVELHGRMKVVNIPKAQVKFVDEEQPSMGKSYMEGGRSEVVSGHNLLPTTPALNFGQTPQHLMGSETPGVYGSMTPSRPDTPGGENVWNPATNLEVSSNSLSQQQQQGFGGQSPMSNYDTSGWQHSGDVNDEWGLDNGRQGYGNSGSGSNVDSVDDWDKDMIVIYRSGPKTGTYAIIVQRPSNGEVAVRKRESSSSGINSDNNPVEYEKCHILRLAECRRKDTVIVLSGKHKGHVAKVKAVLDSDVVLSDLPDEIFRSNQVAWNHLR